MKLRDSRRLTGPNLFWKLPGAILDVEVEPGAIDRVVGLWRGEAHRILDAVGWASERLTARTFAGGASLVMSAPIDALYAATEVNEWAWEAAVAIAGGGPAPDLELAAARLREVIAEERNPALLAMRSAATSHGVCFLSDDQLASIGMGVTGLTWPLAALPEPTAIDWAKVCDVETVLVTGTNGKTTTVRLLAAMLRAAGRVAGVSSTDGLWIGGERIAEGDYSGPGGGRQVLRDPRVEVAILETARGGMLRRGLGLQRADVAVITNVAEDHLGEFGVCDLEALVDTKLIVAKVADRLVLNADDVALRARAAGLGVPVVWFAQDPDSDWMRQLRAAGSEVVVWEDDAVVHYAGTEREVILDDARRVPLVVGGAARHNIQNALGAVAAAIVLGIPRAAIGPALLGFGLHPTDNPGRLDRYDLGGTKVVVDYAHNVHGVEAVIALAGELRIGRLLVLLGQAGDRDDAAIRGLARTVSRAAPDRVILKEMAEYARGRAAGEVTTLLADELRTCGTPADRVDLATSELDGVRRALAWARPGDLLLLLVHAERERVLGLLAELSARGWRPGEPVAVPVA